MYAMKEHCLTIRNLKCDRRLVRGLVTMTAMAWLGASTSCLLVTDRDKDQCATTADCVKKGAAFKATQCLQGVCVSSDGGIIGGCSSNVECLSNPATPNTYCDAEKKCQPIKDSNCSTIVTVDGKSITSDAIILGVLAPLTGDNAPEGEARVRGVKLAHAEFTERAIGIPIGSGRAPHPIALVVCDQVADAEGAATHLAAHVRVPAIIGPGFSGTTVKVAKNVTIPNGTLLMTPSATTPDLATLQDNGLVWRTSSSYEPESKAYADLVAQMEVYPSFRESLGLAADASIKVAVLAKADSYGKGLADSLGTTLRFNGKGTADNNTSGTFARFDLPDLTANPSADTATLVSGIVDTYKPHLILAIGTAEILTKGLEPIEERWITGTNAQPRPFYVISEGAKLGVLVTTVAAAESAHSDRKLKDRIRVFGPRYNDDLYGQMANRYSGANNNEPMPDVYGLTGSYDGFYLIAYALVAGQNAEPTGATIASGLKRLVPDGSASTYSAGPADVSKAIADLVAGRNIDYDGVTGHLDFDVNTGDSPGDYNLYCVHPTQFVQTGQYYLSGESRLVGTYAACP